MVNQLTILNSLCVVLGYVYLQTCAPGLLNAAGQKHGAGEEFLQKLDNAAGRKTELSGSCC